MATKPPKPIDWQHYPIRTCRWLNGCVICRGDITCGQQYYDGGYSRRAHVSCVAEKGEVIPCR